MTAKRLVISRPRTLMSSDSGSVKAAKVKSIDAFHLLTRNIAEHEAIVLGMSCARPCHNVFGAVADEKLLPANTYALPAMLIIHGRNARLQPIGILAYAFVLSVHLGQSCRVGYFRHRNGVFSSGDHERFLCPWTLCTTFYATCGATPSGFCPLMINARAKPKEILLERELIP
jgi:hypothetical protein